MIMEGGCHCKAIRFKVEGTPFWVGACYCVDCRKVSGAPYLVFAGYTSSQFTLLTGTPERYASSEKVERSFCAVCSSPISYSYKENPEKLFLSAGVFDHPENFKIEKHIWVSQKLPWVTITDDAPQSP